MTPDCSYELHFPRSARAGALEALSRVCTPEAAIDLQRAGNEEGESEASLTLALPLDPLDAAALEWCRDNPRMHTAAPDGVVHVGVIALWVKPTVDGRVCVTLWPATTAMQNACLHSRTFRSALVSLLAANRGTGGYVDRGDGGVAEFWPEDDARLLFGR